MKRLEWKTMLAGQTALLTVPEEECKTLCSLLVLWMTRTNQEDVSAVQFHFAWHESHAQGFHMRPISA